MVVFHVLFLFFLVAVLILFCFGFFLRWRRWFYCWNKKLLNNYQISIIFLIIYPPPLKNRKNLTKPTTNKIIFNLLNCKFFRKDLKSNSFLALGFCRVRSMLMSTWARDVRGDIPCDNRSENDHDERLKLPVINYVVIWIYISVLMIDIAL